MRTGLLQRVIVPTRGNNILDFLFTYINLSVNFLFNISVNIPVAQSDRSSVSLELACSSNIDKNLDRLHVFCFAKFKISAAANILSNFDRSVVFTNRAVIDNLWTVFKQKMF